jgi:hypothetical protein
MREIKFVKESLADLIYDLVLNHVREHPDALDGWVSSEDGKIQGAVSIQRGGDNLVAYVYQDEPLSDGDTESVKEQIEASAWDEDEDEDDEDD